MERTEKGTFIAKDLTGKVFGKLTVIENTQKTVKGGGYIWLCECACGNQTTASVQRLTNGEKQSCGCESIASQFKSKDLTNQVFGKLTALKATGQKAHGYYIWLCQCECGKQVEITSQRLLKGNKQNCGCSPLPPGRPARYGSPILNTLFHGYKNAAKERNIEWELDREDFYKMVLGSCTYCGREPFQVYKLQQAKEKEVIRSGIDRIDSSKGYIQENCVSCCKTCNIAKAGMTQKEFKEWIKRVHSHLNL